jgi:predicted dehydrogenase
MKCLSAIVLLSFAALSTISGSLAAEPKLPLRAGMIGLDTSHAVAFTKLLQDPKANGELKDLKIVAAYPGGSPDIPSSRDRVKEYTQQMRGLGVEIVDSIDQLLGHVDVVLLMSVDGRPHLAQARPVIAAGKPLFIDKPMAASLADAVEIFRLARERHVPCFSSSALRFSSGFQAIRQKRSPMGDIRSCVAWSPLHLEPHHPDLFWYGVHGVETLYTIMGPGCKTVTRSAPDKVVGVWADGRTGTFVAKKDYGAQVEGTRGSGPVGHFEGYGPLVVEIVRFFKTGRPPVAAEETLEILAFMEAADESKRLGGAPVQIETIMARAEQKRTGP